MVPRGKLRASVVTMDAKLRALHHVMLKLFLRGRGEGSMPSSSHLKPKSDSIRVPSGEPVVLLELLTE